MQRLLAREERAMRLLDERYGQNLLAVIRRVVDNEVLAQDLPQEGPAQSLAANCPLRRHARPPLYLYSARALHHAAWSVTRAAGRPDAPALGQS